MAIRFLEARASEHADTVEKAVRAVLSQLPIMTAARGAASIGIAGEIAVDPMPVWPTIDPITGEPEEEPVAPSEYYRIGGATPLGALPLKRKL